MDKIEKISGRVIPLAMSDVDTDLIIPAQYLTNIGTSGYGEYAFRRLRDADPDFVLNKACFSGANILLAEDNFGCGSSREHAVWALLDAGIEVVIAQSFADIFYNNSAKKGLLLLEQPAGVIERMMGMSGDGSYSLSIDLLRQVMIDGGGTSYKFVMDPFHRHCFLHGLDQLDYLLGFRDALVARDFVF